jgi:hypothetical protein
MRKRLASLIFAGAAAAAAVALTAPSAFASGGVWTVSPGGSFTASLNSGTTTVLADSSTGVSLTCSTSSASGSLSTPASGSNVLGSITGISWSNCSGVGGLATGSATGSNFPWSLAGTAYNASVDGGQTTGVISGGTTGVGATLNLTIAGSACTAKVGGTTASPATANGGYDNTSGLLAVISTTNLTVTSSNCLDINTGNTVTFSTSPASALGTAISHGYAVSPKQTIVDP